MFFLCNKIVIRHVLSALNFDQRTDLLFAGQNNLHQCFNIGFLSQREQRDLKRVVITTGPRPAAHYSTLKAYWQASSSVFDVKMHIYLFRRGMPTVKPIYLMILECWTICIVSLF